MISNLKEIMNGTYLNEIFETKLKMINCIIIKKLK